MFGPGGPRTRRSSVLPSHFGGTANRRSGRRLAALAKLLLFLAATFAVLWVGKALLWRPLKPASTTRQSRSLAQQQMGEPLKHPSTADTAAQAQDKPARLKQASAAQGLYTMDVEDTDGRSYSLDQYAGQVSLVVNVASQCGYTQSNYVGLQKLYEKYHSQGFEVLAFPCNQFGSQEPGTLSEIMAFAKDQYQVTFPIFPKVEVNGAGEHEIFKFLKENLFGKSSSEMLLSWNFNKFLVNRQGEPVKHYKSSFDEQELETDIEAELSSSSTNKAASA